MTRLFIYLGTILPGAVIKKIIFLDMPYLSRQKELHVGDYIQLHPNNENIQVVDNRPGVLPYNRFRPGIEVSKSIGHECVKYLGPLGGNWPTVQRGHWFPNPGDVDTFRRKIVDACPPDRSTVNY